MNQDEINALLYRQIKPGLEFDHLIPKTTCQSEFVGNGMTDFSISQMREVVKEFSWQAELVADVLEKKTLEETAIAIHSWLYDHFQYNADEKPQYLRTLGCSWFDRKKGIDCKSYSIVASSILTSLEIRHSIRRIKQSGWEPTQWTHVYVIVPKNQKTGNLSEGYYTIDGTIAETQEPDYTEKNDLDMSLPHFVLNGAVKKSGLNGGVNIATITGLFSSLNCIGGDGFKQGDYQWAQEGMIAHFDRLIASLNTAIATKDFTGIATDINEIYAVGKISVTAYEQKLSSGWNDCTTKRLKGMVGMSKFYRDNVGAALTAYVNKYFTKTATANSLRYNANALEEAPMSFRFIYTDPAVIIQEPVFNYAFAPGVTTVAKFEITQYVVDTNGSPTNGASFLSSLVNTLITLLPGSNPNSGNVGTIPGANDGYYNQPGTGTVGTPTTQQAGFGSIIGWGVVLLAAGYAFTQMPSTGKGAKEKSTSKN